MITQTKPQKLDADYGMSISELIDTLQYLRAAGRKDLRVKLCVEKGALAGFYSADSEKGYVEE